MAEIIYDLTNEQYHQSEAISSSDLKTVLTSSLFHWRHKTYKSTPAMDLGTAVHDMVLEGGENTVRGPETRRGKQWSELKALCDADGKTLLTEADFDAAEDMSAALMRDPSCAEILSADDGIREASLFAECRETGLQLRCRPDIYVPSSCYMGDVKTCRDASPRGFSRQVYEWRYDVQAAFYKYVAEMCGWDVWGFYFQAVESARPHAACAHLLSREAIERAEKDMFCALHQIAKAKHFENFPTGWPSFNVIYPPSWMED